MEKRTYTKQPQFATISKRRMKEILALGSQIDTANMGINIGKKTIRPIDFANMFHEFLHIHMFPNEPKRRPERQQREDESTILGDTSSQQRGHEGSSKAGFRNNPL